jgi:hypothetical protein
MKPKCASCIYWEKVDAKYAAENQGVCRRNAPQIQKGREMLFALWPYTHDADWCGEWVQK